MFLDSGFVFVIKFVCGFHVPACVHGVHCLIMFL
jgi:hypothetical protein